MGRRKGDTYRKHKIKEVVRVRCPGWTIPIDLIAGVKDMANELDMHESRLVEVAIKSILTDDSKKPTNLSKIFTKN